MNINAIELIGVIKEALSNSQKAEKLKEIIFDIKELIKDIKDLVVFVRG